MEPGASRGDGVGLYLDQVTLGHHLIFPNVLMDLARTR